MLGIITLRMFGTVVLLLSGSSTTTHADSIT